MALVDGNTYKGVPDDGCASCMFNCFTCCTGFTFVLKSDSDGVTFTDNKFCGGLCYGSPCPCLSYCCFDGPHTVSYKLKKKSDTLYVGDASHSQWKGGCCSGMCHNANDKMELEDGVWYFTPGKNPTSPPCLQGVEKAMHMEKVVGAPPMANATMER